MHPRDDERRSEQTDESFAVKKPICPVHKRRQSSIDARDDSHESVYRSKPKQAIESSGYASETRQASRSVYQGGLVRASHSCPLGHPSKRWINPTTVHRHDWNIG